MSSELYVGEQARVENEGGLTPGEVMAAESSAAMEASRAVDETSPYYGDSSEMLESAESDPSVRVKPRETRLGAAAVVCEPTDIPMVAEELPQIDAETSAIERLRSASSRREAVRLQGIVLRQMNTLPPNERADTLREISQIMREYWGAETKSPFEKE